MTDETKLSTRLFALSLRTLRSRKSLTQQEVAERLGLSSNVSVCFYETARTFPRWQRLLELAAACDATEEEFEQLRSVWKTAKQYR